MVVEILEQVAILGEPLGEPGPVVGVQILSGLFGGGSLDLAHS